MNAVPALAGFALRPLPASVEVEQAVLGALLMHNDLYASLRGMLRAEHFLEPMHMAIYDVAARLIEDGKLASAITVRVFLPELSGEPTMAQYLARLCAEGGLPGNIAHYRDMVFDLAQRREMIGIADRLRDTAYDAAVETNSGAVAYSAVGELQELAARANPATNRREMATASLAFLERMERRRRGEEITLAVPTGIADLDKEMGGLEPQTLIIVAARPGGGKTGFMTSLSNRVAAQGVGVYELSLEVAELQIFARHYADIAYDIRHPLGFGTIMRAGYTDSDAWRLCEAQKRLAALPIVIDVSSRLTLAEIGARARAEQARFARKGIRLGAILIDYMKFIQASDRYKGQRVNEVGEITLGLKNLAKELDTCVVLLTQLNRALEGREDKRPQLSDLRESGDIEQDADAVLFLYREHYYLIKRPEYRNGDSVAYAAAEAVKNKCELILGKCRAGAERTIELWCDVAASSMASHAPGQGRLDYDNAGL